MISDVSPDHIEGIFHAGDTITIYGQNLDLLPQETCMCFAYDEESANQVINWSLGAMQTMPIKERDKNHIVFYRSMPSDYTFTGTLYPIYLTTPYKAPREIVYRFQS